MIRINPDEILKSFGGDWQNNKDNFIAGKEALRLIRDCFDKGLSFNQETTLSDISSINRIIEAKERGYKVNLLYVGLDSPELAIERVRQRVLVGGHGIPEDLIRKRYDKSLLNLEKAIKLCDVSVIYDNTKAFVSVCSFSNGELVYSLNTDIKWVNQLLHNLNCDNMIFDVKKYIVSQYADEFPSIAHISLNTAGKINDLNKQNGERLSYKEIIDRYDKLGKNLDTNFNVIDNQEFKKFSDIVQDFNQARLKDRQLQAQNSVKQQNIVRVDEIEL